MKSYSKILNILIITVFILISWKSFSQETSRKMEISGYLKDLQTIWIDTSSNANFNNLIHNRLNFQWTLNKKFNIHIGMRNRFEIGSNVSTSNNYKRFLEKDDGFLDLTFVPFSGNNIIAQTQIDRFYFDYSFKKLSVRVGRQRINWGLNFVWNPNDLFNNYSFFDFDYEEKSGVDAIRLQYYTGPISSLEVVYKESNTEEKRTYAGLYRFNQFNYDFQILTGKFGDDFVGGIGWSGNIKGAGFRGEITYFSVSHQKDPLIISISSDYSFKNNLYATIGFLYNKTGTTGSAAGFNIFDTQQLSPKKLSLARYSILGQVSYPITPLLTGSLNCILNPSDNSFFIGPNMTYSLSQNIETSVMAQIFVGEKSTEFGDYGRLYFLRLRYSF
ncbi:MAG: hypothetical protein OEL54_01275 [Flavobacteriaceae bacterium]|nr:hypothetical protein [Flavobacteriaceae bacterium]